MPYRFYFTRCCTRFSIIIINCFVVLLQKFNFCSGCATNKRCCLRKQKINMMNHKSWVGERGRCSQMKDNYRTSGKCVGFSYCQQLNNLASLATLLMSLSVNLMDLAFSTISFRSINIKGEGVKQLFSLLCTLDKFAQGCHFATHTYLLSFPLSQAIQKSSIKGSCVGLGVLAKIVKWKINSVSITKLQEHSTHSSEMTVSGKQLIGHQLWRKYILPDLCHHLPCSLVCGRGGWVKKKKKNTPG